MCTTGLDFSTFFVVSKRLWLEKRGYIPTNIADEPLKIIKTGRMVIIIMETFHFEFQLKLQLLQLLLNKTITVVVMRKDKNFKRGVALG